MRSSSLAPHTVVVVALLAVACTAAPARSHPGFVDAPIAAVASPIAGNVDAILVREGDHVHRGDVIVRIDARERRALVTQAEANVEHARAALREAERNAESVEPTVLAAEADIVREQAELDDATADYERASRLAASGAFTQQQLDTAANRLAAARAGVSSGSASQLASRRRVLAALAGVRTARAALASTQAALELARVQVAEAEIASPCDGIVAERNTEEGEWVGPGTPVVTIEDTTRQWVRLDVEETALDALHIGTAAHIRVIALEGHPVEGHVIEIGAEGEFAIDRDVRRGRPDVRTFRVRVAIDPPDDQLRPGMSASVELAPEPS